MSTRSVDDSSIGLSSTRSAMQPSGSHIDISANPARRRAYATLQPNFDPYAYVQHVPENEAGDGENYELYGLVSGKRFKSHLAGKDQQFQQLVNKVGKLGNKLIRKHWDKTAKRKDVEIGIGRLGIQVKDEPKIGKENFKEKIEEIIKRNGHLNAAHFHMDFSDMSLRFMENGHPVEIKKEDLPQDVKDILEFLESWEEAHEKAMEIMGLRVWHGRYNFEGNRPMHGDIAFQLENPQYERYRPKTIDDYFKEGQFEYDHFKLLMEELPDHLKPGADARIQRAGRFIDSFGQKLAAKITDKESQLAAALDANRKKLEKEIETLKKLKDKHAGIDLVSVFTAAAFVKDNEPITDGLLSERAGLVTNARLNMFKKVRGLSSEKWNLRRFQGASPDQDALKSIAIQNGDLYFHSDLDYLKRFNGSGAKRMVRPSQEEFVIHNLLRRDDPDYVDDLRSFGLQEQDPEFQAELRELVNQARIDASSP